MKKKNASLSHESLIKKFTLTPYSIWAVVFIVVPLLFIAYYAFTDNDFHFTFSNLTAFFTTVTQQTDGTTVHTYLYIFWRSVKLAVISTVICLLLGYPLAYFMSKMKPKTQRVIMVCLMIPMWMNFLIRTYAWMTILQDTGLINTFLSKIGLGQVHIIGTEGAVVIGMVYDFFPYMVLPIYSVMDKLDVRLIEAAHDLGCNGVSVLRRVILPLSLPGVITGVTMVLIPSISTFYISQKLGSGKFYLIGDAIEAQYTANNLHLAAAIAFILMVILLVAIALMQRAANKRAYVK